ncbi:MAG: DUF2203 domain-containing protein [Blastocatellia bacterium]|nr:DUF2203 domain-containing protein [Blastocatellia bacterium]
MSMKLFTLAEAKALLPEIKRLFDLIDRSRAKMRNLSDEARLASEATGGGGTVYGLQYARALSQLMISVQEILGLGVEIKDFDRGLCDFPHEREGRIVYLCWQRGEDDIEWWHDIDAGFSGRQPL